MANESEACYVCICTACTACVGCFLIRFKPAWLRQCLRRSAYDVCCWLKNLSQDSWRVDCTNTKPDDQEFWEEEVKMGVAINHCTATYIQASSCRQFGGQKTCIQKGQRGVMRDIVVKSRRPSHTLRRRDRLFSPFLAFICNSATPLRMSGSNTRGVDELRVWLRCNVAAEKSCQAGL
ncbi:hypothetical protein HD806DRAFT_66605 [Xylariaceae sp. AK1471]|nr:hypothetical protein HD806DRAFT_66605 [Xylariaceae sp. AK1471]